MTSIKALHLTEAAILVSRDINLMQRPRQVSCVVDMICIATDCAKIAFHSDLWRNRCANNCTC